MGNYRESGEIQVRKKVARASVMMYVDTYNKIITPDEKVNHWLKSAGVTAEELRGKGVNVVAFFPSKTVAYIDYSLIDGTASGVLVLVKDGKVN
jgi:hypothetical protein